jgi:N-acetylmuramoyl-L-alanine amidase
MCKRSYSSPALSREANVFPALLVLSCICMLPLTTLPDESVPAFSRREILRRLTLAAGALSAPGFMGAAAPEFRWKLIQHEGRDYVSASDVQRFYEFPRLDREGRNLWFRAQRLAMRWTSGSDVIYMNNVKFCLCFNVIEQDGKLYISRMDLSKLIHPIIKPSHIDDVVLFDTIVIDAGHGGEDSGAVGPNGLEKHYALDTANRLSLKLKALGYKIVLTRSSDVFISRPRRVEIANSVQKAIFVSLHYNSYTSSAAGIETFALAPQGTANTDHGLKESDLIGRKGNRLDSQNIALATAVHANCLYMLRSIDRGIKRHRFDVLAGIERPAILVEGGFLTNPTEAARVHKSEYRDKLADAITGGIQNFRKALQAGINMRRAAPAGSARR